MDQGGGPRPPPSLNGCNLRITCDNIYTNLFHKLDMVAL